MSFDHEALERISGGDHALAIELVDMLLRALPEQRRSIGTAHREVDLATLARIAHTVSGGAAYCGAPALKGAADALENAAARGDRACLADAVEDVYREMAALTDGAHSP